MWHYALASVVGTQHQQQGQPCQDCARVAVTHDADAQPVLVAVASDGAGSAPRGQQGALRVCEAGTRRALALLATTPIAHISEAQLALWAQALRTTLEAQALAEGAPLRHYACTLVAALVGPTQAWFVQVGDGAAVYADTQTGQWQVPIWPAHGEYANTTFFLTDPDYASHLHCRAVGQRICRLGLFTDGLEHLLLDASTRQGHAPALAPLLAPLQAQPGTTGYNTALSEHLARFLASERVCARTHDDKTLILAVRNA